MSIVLCGRGGRVVVTVVGRACQAAACTASAEPSTAYGCPSLMLRQPHCQGQAQEHFQLAGARNQRFLAAEKMRCS